MRISDWSADVCSSDLTGLELPANVLGHEGDFSPDGMTYWATGLALGAITAIDVSDPTQPRIVYTGIAGFAVNHGVEFSAAGRRMYSATLFPGGVLAYDITDIQDRVPPPRMPVLARKIVLTGTRAYARVELGGIEIINKKKDQHINHH